MERLQLQILGSFRLSNGAVTLGEENFRSRKSTRLLAYIIMNRDTILTQRKLIDTFWGDESRGPENALKNLIYRLRNSLKLMGEEEYICTLPGAYRWNPEIIVETDYEHFEDLERRLGEVRGDTEEEKKLCNEILNCYNGNVSDRLINEAWIIPKVMQYRSLYIDTVKKLCRIYEKEEEWNKIETICVHALAEDSLDEDIHCCLMRSLSRQSKYDLALDHYKKANLLFYENLGVWNMEKLNTVFQEITKPVSRVSSLSDFLKSIQVREPSDGVFFCDCQIFSQIYQMEARRTARTGMAGHLMLLTIRRTERIKRDQSVVKKLEESATALEHVIHEVLQCGDVAAKFSPSQFALLLPVCSYDECVKTANRIQEKFWGNQKMRRVELICEIAKLSPSGQTETGNIREKDVID